MLKKWGYKAELFRGFNSVMNFSLCFTAVSIISSLTVTFGNGLALGGPVCLTWGWLVVSFFTILIGFAMAEICSTYPSAGSVYHWTAMLASKSWAPSISYICGWFNLLGNAAGDASFSFGFSSMVAAADSFQKGDGTVWENYQVFLLCFFINIIWALKNCAKVE